MKQTKISFTILSLRNGLIVESPENSPESVVFTISIANKYSSMTTKSIILKAIYSVFEFCMGLLVISFWEKTKVGPKAWCHCVLIALIPLEPNAKVQRSLVCFWSERPKGWFLAIISIRAADRELWLWSPNGGRLVVLRRLTR